MSGDLLSVTKMDSGLFVFKVAVELKLADIEKLFGRK